MDWQVTITNLFKKAEDPAATPEERDALTAKATYLMTTYGITELLEQADKIPVDAESMFIAMANPYRLQRQRLAHSISRSMGVRTITLHDKVHVFGLPNDLKRYSMLFATLWIQALLGLAGSEKPVGVHGKTHSHSYLLGFIDAVSARVSTAAQRANTDHQKTVSTDLVLANRQTIVDKAVSDVYPRLTYGKRGRAAQSHSSYGTGHTAGLRADINQSRMGRASASKTLTN